MPSALILGALTVVGVELVKVLVTSGRFSPIRAVDISLLELAEISDDYKQYFKQVEFVQANFVLKTAASKCFDREGEFDYVFNCGIHLKPDSSEEYYRLYLMQRALHAATEAAKRGVKVFVEESSAYDYAVKGKGDWCTEADPMAKRGLIGTCRVETVEALRQIPGLNLIVVRCGMLYGPTEKVRMATALLTAYMLHRGGEGLEWALPYDPEMRLNSVHSHDAARAMLHVTECVIPTEEEIDAGRMGANGIAMECWMDIVEECGIQPRRLSPYLYKESYVTHPVAVDTTKLKQTGFTFQYPSLTGSTLHETVIECIKLNAWPQKLGPLPVSTSSNSD